MKEVTKEYITQLSKNELIEELEFIIDSQDDIESYFDNCAQNWSEFNFSVQVMVDEEFKRVQHDNLKSIFTKGKL